MEKLQQFLDQRPAIRLHYEQEGTFSDFCRHFRSRVPTESSQRLPELLVKHIKGLNRPEIHVPLLRQQLQRYPLISTADHAGLLNFSILYNANILMLGMLEKEALPYQIVFSTGRIPINNISHPRGFRFQGNKHNFFPSSMNRVMVSLLSEGMVCGENGRLEDVIRPDSLKSCDSEQKKFLEHLFFDSLDLEATVKRYSGFNDQLSLVNPKIFSLCFGKELRQIIPQMIYFRVEPIVFELICQDLANPSSLLYCILFEKKVRDVYLQEFSDIIGCWTQTGGTHFFWGVSQKRYLISLKLNSDCSFLYSPEDDAFTPIELSPESIVEALLTERIIPSLFIDMLMMAFIEGFTLLGGFNQVTYMAWMRVAHERCMLRLGDWPMAARFARTPTDGLICGPLPFPQWESSLDMIWHHNSTNGKFNGNLDGGLSRKDLDAMMSTPMKTLIQNGVDSMMNVVE